MANRKRVLSGLAVVALVAAAGAGAWYYEKATRPAGTQPPAVPVEVVDVVIRDALDAARQKVIAAPRSAAAWGDYGLLLIAHLLTAESNACFAQASRLDPQDPRWPYLIGLSKTQDDPNNALPYFRTAHRVAFRPEHRTAARLRLAEVLLVHNAYDEAVALFQEELAADPNSVRARYGLAVVATARDDPEAVVRYLATVADHPTVRQKAAALLGPAYQRLGNAAAADRASAQISRPPADQPAPDPFISEYLDRAVGRQAEMSRVRSLELEGRYREALPVLEGLRQNYPKDFEVQLTLAIMLTKTGEFERAEQLARDVVEKAPDHSEGHFYLGTILATWAQHDIPPDGRIDAVRPRFEAAVAEYRQAAKLKPGYTVAHLSAGLALRALDRLPEAVVEFRAAVAASPGLAGPHMEVGRALLEMGDPGAAIPPLLEAIRLEPRNAQAVSLLEKARAGVKQP